MDGQQNFNDQGKITHADYDTNHNGKADRWEIFDSKESLTVVQFDIDSDSKPDQFQHFYPSGKLKKVEFDTNSNGQIDRWEFYNEDEKLNRIELDRNHDGKPDMIKQK